MTTGQGESLIGKTIGKYRITGGVGQGGMGAVYSGHDTVLDRQVAIKVLAPHLVWDQTFVERFMREAQMAARMDHPNIVTIYDVGQQQSTYYLVMRLVDGIPLSGIIAREGQMAPARSVPIVAQMAAALDYAHSRGIIHRDVKPANILIENGDRVALTDFGVARAAEGTRLTATGISLGTPEYMSPEQARGDPVDGRSDVYSLGVVLYEMLTGRVPFQADTPLATLMHQTQTPPPSPRTLAPSLPLRVEQVVMKALAKRPEERFSTAGELARALEQAVGGDQSQQLRQQMNQVGSLLAAGKFEAAIERLEGLARAHPGNKEVGQKLAQAREQARVENLYTDLRGIWARAQSRAGEIVAAAPQHADPDGLIAQLRGAEPKTREMPTYQWPAWATLAGLGMLIVGGLSAILAHLPSASRGGDVAVYLLLIALGALSTRKQLPRRIRQGLALAAVFLVLLTASQTWDLLPRPYLFGQYSGAQSLFYVLEVLAALGVALLAWSLFVEPPAGVGDILVMLGGLVVILSYSMDWTWLNWDRGLSLIYQETYPWWLGTAAVLLPATSLLGTALLRPSSNLGGSQRKSMALASIVLASLALFGMLLVGSLGYTLVEPRTFTSLFAVGYIGVWLMLIGLGMVLLGVVLRSGRALRER